MGNVDKLEKICHYQLLLRAKVIIKLLSFGHVFSWQCGNNIEQLPKT